MDERRRLTKEELKKFIEESPVDISFFEYCTEVEELDTENPHTPEYWGDFLKRYIQWCMDNNK